MDRRSVLIGSIGGVGITALVLFALPELMRSAERTRVFFDFPGFRWVILWLALLGAVLGMAIIVSERYPLVVAVPAVLLGYGYYVIGLGWFAFWPRWVPQSIVMGFLRSFGLAALVVVGVFATVAVWRLSRIYRRQPSAADASVARAHLVAGAIGGIAVAVGLVLVLERLSLALFRHAMVRDLTGAGRAMFGLFAVGASLGAVVVVSERVRSLAVSAALASLLLVGLNPLYGLAPYDWVTSAVLRLRLFLPPDTAVIIGMLVAVGAWRLLEARRSADHEVAEPGGEPAPPVYVG